VRVSPARLAELVAGRWLDLCRLPGDKDQEAERSRDPDAA
jgi:hypothetical protein